VQLRPVTARHERGSGRKRGEGKEPETLSL
jgi:hypothetical protein